MAGFDHEQLVRYLVGEATAADQRAIDEGAARDEELAAELAVLRAIVGEVGRDSDNRPAAKVLAWKRLGGLPSLLLSRRRMLAAAVTLFVVGAGWGTWQCLKPQPLLQDNFNNEWLDPTIWSLDVRPVVLAENGYVRLMDRGYLVTAAEFTPPFQVDFDWRWMDLAGHPHYREQLTVVLRTSGRPGARHAFDSVDGVRIILDAVAGNLVIRPEDERVRPTMSAEGSVPIPARQWHHVTISDDGETIRVTFRPAKAARPEDAATWQMRCPGRFQHYHVAIYNRERVADVSHESHIDNVVIRAGIQE